MKPLYLITACILLHPVLRAQQVLKVQPGSSITVTNGAVITLHDMDLDNDGTISLAPGSGSFVFTGAGNNVITGSAIPQFDIMQIAKTGTGKVSLQQHIHIASGITFTSGMLDLNTKNIILQPAALLLGESENSRIIGPGGGYIEITQDLNAPTQVNPGNLGALITSPENLGITTIRRGHQSQANAFGLGTSVLRNYEIIPANNNNLNATLRIQYFEAELNTLDENSLTLWKSTDRRAWSSDGFSARDLTANYIEKNGIAATAFFTLSSINNALPLQFLLFNVRCVNNEVAIQWKTAQEVNTSHFNIERSIDGIHYTTIATVTAAGNYAGERSYSYTDHTPLSGQAFYRIVADDLDGSKRYTGINRTNCNMAEGVKVWPNPVQDQCWLNIHVNRPSPVYIHLYNSKGQLVLTRQSNLLAGSNQLPLNMASLPAGNYQGIVTWDQGAGRHSFNLLKLAQ